MITVLCTIICTSVYSQMSCELQLICWSDVVYNPLLHINNQECNMNTAVL